ncbi:MAG: hypothetical protein AAF197_07725 [Pseudomonadota bacterium]
MKIKLPFMILVFSTFLASTTASACMEHYMFEQGRTGFSQYTSVYSSLPKPKPKLFIVKHPSIAIAVVDKEQELSVKYDLPLDAKNVSLSFSSNQNIDVLDETIELDDSNGVVTARFRPLMSGVNMITVTVAGEHAGEQLSYASKMYVRSQAAST